MYLKVANKLLFFNNVLCFVFVLFFFAEDDNTGASAGSSIDKDKSTMCYREWRLCRQVRFF